jgi:hypothetical protein
MSGNTPRRPDAAALCFRLPVLRLTRSKIIFPARSRPANSAEFSRFAVAALSENSSSLSDFLAQILLYYFFIQNSEIVLISVKRGGNRNESL